MQATIAALLATPASASVRPSSATGIPPTPTPAPTAAPFPTAIWAPTAVPTQALAQPLPPPLPTTTGSARTVTPPTPTPTLRPTATAVPEVSCQLATDGTPVTAWIDDGRVALTHVADGLYTLFVEQRLGASFAGKIVVFKIGDVATNESGIWAHGGGDELDLTAISRSAAATFAPTPSPENEDGQLDPLAQPVPPHIFLGTVSLCAAS